MVRVENTAHGNIDHHYPQANDVQKWSFRIPEPHWTEFFTGFYDCPSLLKQLYVSSGTHLFSNTDQNLTEMLSQLANDFSNRLLTLTNAY